MQKLFNKILVPIDFSQRSKKVLDKAADIAKQYNCCIHLLHVANVSPFLAMGAAQSRTTIAYDLIDNREELSFQLEELCSYVRAHSNGTINTEYSILQGPWDETIIAFVNQNKIDLVLIGQKGRIIGKRKLLLNPDRIAAKTNIPVITIPSNRRLTRLGTIVIPITDFLPVRKLLYGLYIASGNITTLKLLGIENEKTKEKVQYYLKKAYQLIHDNSDVQVYLETVHNENVAEAVNEFAMRDSADLIILNPGSQTKMPGFFSSLLGNIFQRYSAPPVLTVNPV